MKNLIIIPLLIFSFFSLKAQNTNQLSPAEFENISINGKTLKSIWQTKGDEAAVKSLFGTPQQKVIEDDTPGALSLRYEYNGFRLSFTEMINAEGNLSAFKITNSTVALNLKGTTIKIGDSITKLGRVPRNDRKDGGKSVVFSPENDETVYLTIDFDPATNIITKISYFVLT